MAKKKEKPEEKIIEKTKEKHKGKIKEDPKVRPLRKMEPIEGPIAKEPVSDLDEQDKRRLLLEIWPAVSAAHESMMDRFPTLWDAYWYGSLACVFSQIKEAVGDKEAAKILGKKNLDVFEKEHMTLLDDMYASAFRDFGFPDDIPDDFEEE